MSKFNVITVGGAVKDHTLYTDDGKIFSTPDNLTSQKMIAFEYGAKIKMSQAYVTLGGGATNAAMALTKLGLKTATICCLGKDEAGKEIVSNLAKNKINIDLVSQDNKYLTGFSFIIIADKKDKDRTIFNYVGAGEYLEIDERKIAKADTKWFYISSLSGSKWNKNLKTVFKVAKRKKSKIFWNPGQAQLRAGQKALLPYLKQTDILSLNKDEAIELVLSGVKIGRKDPKHFNKLIYLSNILHEWGPKIVIITDGTKGSTAYDGNKIYKGKIRRSEVLDRTGVGDCYGSSFLAGYIKSGSIEEATQWAMVNSAAVVTKVGAQNGLLTKKELLKKI